MSRLPEIDGLRAIAALSVASYHIYTNYYPELARSKVSLLNGGFDQLFKIGGTGVQVFLVLSGFCLALPHLRNGLRSIEYIPYIKKRCKRILPPYLILTLVILIPGLIHAIRHFHSHHHNFLTTTINFLSHLFLIQNLFENSYFFGQPSQTWTIALEFQLYLIFPLVYRAVATPCALLLVTSCVGALWWGFGYIAHIPATAHAYYWSVLGYSPLFVCGILTAYLYTHKIHLSAYYWYLSIPLFGLYLFVQNAHILLLGANPMLFGGAITALTLVGQRPMWLNTVLGYKLLVYIGERSYTLYLIHLVVIETIESKFHVSDMTGFMRHSYSTLTLALCVVLTAFAYPWLEGYFLNKPKALLNNS